MRTFSKNVIRFPINKSEGVAVVKVVNAEVESMNSVTHHKWTTAANIIVFVFKVFKMGDVLKAAVERS